MVIEKRNEEIIQGYRNAAFTSFLLTGEQGTTFDSYIESLGLGNKVKPKKVSKEDALKKAEDILAIFKEK